jgi:5-formyltetrahydrofolate cyclo-ligase
VREIVSGKQVVAGYFAVRGELDVGLALEEISGRGCAVCMPVVVGKDLPLLFRRWSVGGALERGTYGIDVPLASEPELVPDIVLVPLVGFDRLGHRLGYGAGYYDRTISGLREANRHVRVIGVGYGVQEVEMIPAEAHDMRLDGVITELGMVG